jgi:uracil-DNA glycosylase
MSAMTSGESLSALRWLIEAGADETLAEAPVNRFASRAPVAAAGAAPRSAIPVPDPPARPRMSGSSAPQGESRKTDLAAQAVSLSTVPGAARAVAASCKTLAELKAALEKFEGIEIKRSAKNTVFADGNPLSRIMLIGEAPGRDEDEQGLPFVGRAGQLLDRMLGAIGLDRTKVYITNVLNWRPPQNREPSPEEAAACLPFLHRHIELVAPEVMILLGAVAVRHVLGVNEGIMRLRGRWESYQSAALGRAIQVMPALHPAYLLRQPSAKRLAWRDLCAVADKIEELKLA